MFDLVNKAKRFLNQTQDDTPDEFSLSQQEVDRILKEEIDDKFEALEKQHAAEMVAAAKESERAQLAQKLQDEALLRRQVLQDSNSTTQQIQKSLQTISAKATNDPEIAELQNLLTTLGEVRNSSSHTDEAMAQFLVNCNLEAEPPKRLSLEEQMNMIEVSSNKTESPHTSKHLSIEEQMNMMGSSVPTPPPTSSPRQSIDDAMNSLFNSTMQFVDNTTKPDLSEIDMLKKAMGF
jgi:hypothetical protein